MAAMVASAHRFFGQVRLRTIIACDLLSLCLMVILVLGPVISISSGQPDHDQASVSAPAGEPLESSIPCDAGVLCSAFLLPADTSAGQIAAVAMALETADETLQRGFGDPARANRAQGADFDAKPRLGLDRRDDGGETASDRPPRRGDRT